MSEQPTVESFLKDVATHQLMIVRDDGLYRHLRFKRPASGCMYFDIITWPGYLCYTGDMGTYVFSRIDDMLAFFRSTDAQLKINAGYWSEKVQADSIYGNGLREFSEDRFRENLKHDFDNHFESDEPDEDADVEERAKFEARKAAAWEEVEDQILSLDSLEHDGFQAAMRFQHEGLSFTDFWDHTFTVFTYHYIWCCFALVWGIQQYDAAKAAEVAA
jgi:hypothetical protein